MEVERLRKEITCNRSFVEPLFLSDNLNFLRDYPVCMSCNIRSH